LKGAPHTNPFPLPPSLLLFLAFTLFLLVGQFFFALGGVYKSFPLMLLGRAIYGLGGENMSVAQSSLVAEWFRVRREEGGREGGREEGGRVAPRRSIKPNTCWSSYTPLSLPPSLPPYLPPCLREKSWPSPLASTSPAPASAQSSITSSNPRYAPSLPPSTPPSIHRSPAHFCFPSLPPSFPPSLPPFNRLLTPGVE